MATLKKCILLFDEIHFIDRPSFTFGHFGTIATPSPLRPYERSFREEGVPLYIHSPRDGPVSGEFLAHILSDVNDLEFLKCFQNGLRESPAFRSLQIPPGNYGEVGNEEDVARALVSVNLAVDLDQYASPVELFKDREVDSFRYGTTTERTKELVTHALTCSAMLNLALDVSQQHDVTPLADAAPYQSLLGAKYARAVKALGASEPKIQLTDLSFAILDEVLSGARLARLTLKDIINYRKAADAAREDFLEHLAALRVKQGSIARGDDYTGALRNIVVADIIPEAHKFKGKIEEVYERLFGSLAIGAITSLGAGPAALQIFGDLSWPNILRLAGVTGAAIGTAAIRARCEIRTANRDCAISYLLGLDRE